MIRDDELRVHQMNVTTWIPQEMDVKRCSHNMVFTADAYIPLEEHFRAFCLAHILLIGSYYIYS